MTPKTSKAPVGSNIAPKKNPYGSPKKGTDKIDMNPVKSDQETLDPEMYKDSMDAAGKRVTSNTPVAKPAKLKGIQREAVAGQYKGAEKAKQASIKRAIKLFNKLVDQAGDLEERGKQARANKLNKQATEVNDMFAREQGMSIPDYEEKQNVAGRNVADIVARIKTADLKPGSSTNLIAKEAGSVALLIHILRDVAGQLDDEASNLLSGFLSSNAKTNPPTKNQVAVANAVADRVKELGLHKEYAGKTVDKLEKHSRSYAYDKNNPPEFEDEY